LAWRSTTSFRWERCCDAIRVGAGGGARGCRACSGRRHRSSIGTRLLPSLSRTWTASPWTWASTSVSSRCCSSSGPRGPLCKALEPALKAAHTRSAARCDSWRSGVGVNQTPRRSGATENTLCRFRCCRRQRRRRARLSAPTSRTSSCWTSREGQLHGRRAEQDVATALRGRSSALARLLSLGA